MKDNVYTSKLLEVMQVDEHTDMHCSYVFLVMPYQQSNLMRLLSQTARINFNEEHIVTLFYNFLCSLNFIHTAGLIHRDIKPANLLIDKNCRVFLADFGMSCLDPSSFI